jgi:hypothetical protein
VSFSVSSFIHLVAFCNARLFHMLQVYGGAISVMVGPHAWSFIGTGFSNASCGDTICELCAVSISNTSIANSRAVSSSSGNVDAAHLSALIGACFLLAFRCI